jgi:hypothetical protein
MGVRAHMQVRTFDVISILRSLGVFAITKRKYRSLDENFVALCQFRLSVLETICCAILPPTGAIHCTNASA